MTNAPEGLRRTIETASVTGAALHLRGLNIVDVVRGDVRKTPVTIAGGRIIANDDTMWEDNAVLDLDGCWATPSLVDVHAHVTFEPRAHDGLVSFSFDDPPELGTMRAVQNLTEALRNGICLVRDAGGRQAHLKGVMQYLADGCLLLPELVTCGEPLCRLGGHGSAFGQHASSTKELELLITRHAAAGHEWLKVMNGPELWPEPELVQVVSLAHHAGLRTAVHAFTPEGIRAAVRAGANTIEHGMVADPEVISEARRFGTWFVPTAYCSWISLRPRFTRTQPFSEIVHLEYWFDYLDQCRPAHVANRIPILPGTDAGCAPCSFDDYLEELAYFERWGLDPMAVLQNATIRAAECLGRDANFGSIDVGKWANLIVTERDPTSETSHLRQPVLVFYKGADVVNALGERWP